jgi:hypothetical protein
MIFRKAALAVTSSPIDTGVGQSWTPAVAVAAGPTRPRPVAGQGAHLADGVGPPAGMIAVRVADLVVSGTGMNGGGALVLAGDRTPIVSGELVVFCQPVLTAAAVVRRDGRVQAGGWLPEHVRLGTLEAQIGVGVVEELVAPVARARVAAGEQGGAEVRQRVMDLTLALRFVVAMTLMPDASYVEVMARIVGLLPGVPWPRPWQVPTSTVLTGWRRLVGVQPVRQLFWRVAGSIVDAATALWCGLELCAIDGFATRVPDTAANRAAFGSAGTADDSAPFPQLHAVIATARAGRAILGAAVDASSVGEQTLTARLVKEHPEVFCQGRVFLVDRNFLGHGLIVAIGKEGAYLVMRVKAGITLHFVRWLPDGSYLAYLDAPDRLSVLLLRVVEYDVEVPGTDGVSELFCLATTLLDWRTHPAQAVCDAYPQRWSASETTIGENKSTITDAGPSRGPILRSKEPALVHQEFLAWLTATQLVRKAAHAATTATAKPVTTDQVSFTAVRHEATRSMTQTLVTATTSPQAQAAAADTAARTVLTSLVATGRDRHSERARKHQPRFRHTSKTTPTTRGPFPIHPSRGHPPPGHDDTS